jgi:hypothetical protein
MQRVIRIEPAAPDKPAPGQPCNGCGVCCLSQPCPLGVLASRRTSGPCAALRWHGHESRYRCGLVDPRRPIVSRLARRWIAAGSGCDSSAEVLPG